MEQRSQPGTAGGRPMVWLGTGMALVFCLLMLFMPFAFQNEQYRYMYPVIRPYGAVFGLSALLGLLGLTGVGVPRWLAVLGDILLVLGLTGWVATQAAVGGLSPSLTGFLILVAGFVLAFLLPRFDQFLFRAVFAAMLLWMISVIFLGRLNAPEMYAKVPRWVDFVTLVPALLQPIGHMLRKRMPTVSWASMLTVAAPLGWVTYAWMKQGNWMGVGIAGTLTLASVAQAFYLRRPWQLKLPGMRRRILVLALMLAVVPVLVMGALSTYRVQQLGREQSLATLYAAVMDLDQQVTQLLRDRPGLQSDPAALRAAVGGAVFDGLEPVIVKSGDAPPEWRGQESGALEEAPPGQGRRLVAFRRRHDADLIVAVTQSAAIAYAGAATNSALVLLGAVLISALAVVLATLLSGRITAQLEEVRAAVWAIGQHQYEVRALLHEHPDDEVSLLAAAVAEMAVSLEASREEIQAQNEELQSQQEELATQNEELSAQTEELVGQNELLRDMQRELRLHARQHAVIAELGQQALTENDLGKLAAVVAEQVKETLGVSYSGIFELLPDGRRLRLRAGAGWAENRVGQDIVPMDHPDLSHVWAAREPVVVEQPSMAAAFAGSGLFDGGQALSGIEVAIRGDDRLLGFLGVYWPHHNRVTHQDLHFVQALANKLATLMLRNKAQRLLAAEHDVTRALATADSLDTAVPRLLSAICEPLEWHYGALWLVDREGPVLRCFDASACANERAHHFINASRHRVLALGDGLPGKAWASDSPLWIEDVQVEPACDRKEAAAAAGLHGAFFVPVRSGREVVGVIEFFSSDIRQSDPALLQSMEAISGQIGLFVQRIRVEAERALLLASERASRQREAFRADAASLLTASLDLADTLDRVSRLPVPFLADYCLVDVQAGSLRQAVSFHGVPAQNRVLAELYRRYPPQLEGPGGYGELLRTGKPFLLSEVPEGFFKAASVDADQLRMTEQVGTLSLIAVPLIAHGRGLGVLVLGITESDRRYGPTDLSLAEDLASRVAMAIDNARLYTESQESFAVLDTLLESAPVGFGFFDKELHYQRVNEALAGMTGLPVEAHLGKTIREVVPDVADVLEPVVRRVLTTGEPVHNWDMGGTTAATPDQLHHWMLSIYPVRTRDGVLIGVGGVVTEITERKRMEEALRVNESLLVSQQAVLEQIATGEPLLAILHALALFVEERIADSHVAVVLLNEQGTHLRYVAAPTLPESFYGPLGDFPVGPDVRTCGAAICRKELVVTADIATDPLWDASRELAISHGLAAGWSAPIMAANDEVYGTITLLYPERRTPSAEDLRVAGIATRIAAIAIERQRLEESRSQKLHSLVEHMAEGVIAVDEDWRLVFLNDAARHLLEMEEPEPGRSLADLGLPEPLKQMIESALEHSRYTPERSVFRQGNTEIDALVSPVYTELSRYGAFAVLQDVTAETQFRRLQQSFVANVSHELRGPLASLSATLEALVDGVIPDEKRQRYLIAMLSEMERLRRLSHEVIDLTRLDSGVVELNSEEFTLGPVFESIGEKMQQRCDSAGLHLLVDPPNLRVVGDFDKVEQVVLNLLDNAVRFTPEGGTIRLFARRQDEMVRVIVADTGPGIPAEHLPYIWERFYKADAARTLKPGSGTGLGLAIVKQTVERMGGSVQVESEPDQGAVFSFTLPLAEG